MQMQQRRDTASASIGEVLKLGQQFLSQDAKEHINNEISPAVSRIVATSEGVCHSASYR